MSGYFAAHARLRRAGRPVSVGRRRRSSRAPPVSVCSRCRPTAPSCWRRRLCTAPRLARRPLPVASPAAARVRGHARGCRLFSQPIAPNLSKSTRKIHRPPPKCRRSKHDTDTNPRSHDTRFKSRMHSVTTYANRPGCTISVYN